MADRTVNVKMRASYGEYLSATARAGQSTKQLKQELTSLGQAQTKLAAQERALVKAKMALGEAEIKAAKAAVGEAASTKELEASKKSLLRAQAAVEAQEGRVATASAAVNRQLEAEKTKHAEAVKATSEHAVMLGAGLVGAFGLAINATLSFDRQMSAVGAATQSSTSDLRALRQAAIQAGQATVFGATDAAKAEEELAKAGIAVKDILSGALLGALNLATAGDLDLGQAAEIAASAMTQFSLKGKDVPHIADLLAAGAGKAQGSVEDLGVALKYVGPVAGQMGVSIEQTTGTIAELASNGILADQAGTSLRGILSSLTSPSAKAADTMKELGINVYDARGNFVGFSGVAGQLHDKLGGLTNAQRDAALGTLFGNEQITAARILYAGGADAVQSWTKQVNDSGYAARFAAARMDNLSGDIEQLKGSLETALIKQGSGATAVLRSITEHVTGMVNAFSNLPEPVQAAITAVSLFAGGLLLVGGGIGVLIPKIEKARTELEETGRVGRAASASLGFLGRIGGYAAGITLAADAAKTLKDHLDDLLTKVTGHGKDPFKGAHILTFDEADFFDRLQIQFDDFDASKMRYQLERVAAGAEDGSKTFSTLATWLRQGGQEADAAKESFKNLDKYLTDLRGEDPKAASLVMMQVAKALDAQGFSADQITKLFPQYSAALEQSGVQAKIAKESVAGYASATDDAAGKVGKFTSLMAGSKLTTDGLTDATKNAADALGLWNDQFDYFIGRNKSLVVAEADFKQALAEGSKAIKENGRSLSDNTEAGQKNIDMFGGLIDKAQQTSQAVLNQTGSTDEATLSLWKQIEAIRQMGIKAGISKGAMDQMLGKMLGVAATKVEPTIQANITAAMRNIQSLRTALDRLDGKTVKTYAYNFVQDVVRGRGGGKIGQSTGGIAGRDFHPAGPTDTEGPYWLTRGEGVLRTAAVTRIGGPGVVDALNAGRPLPAMATGAAGSGAVTASPAGRGALTVSLDPADRALLRAVADAAGGPRKFDFSWQGSALATAVDQSRLRRPR